MTQLSPWLDATADWEDSSLLCIANAIAGHHGVPVDAVMADEYVDCEDGYCSRAIGDATELAADLRSLFDVNPTALTSLAGSANGVTERLSWRLAGLLVVADWLGSNADWFPMRAHTSRDLPLPSYWREVALPAAKMAVRHAGLASAAWSSQRGLAALASFTHKPRPLQAFVDSVSLKSGPALVCIEDSTGSGKTEAAIAIAHRIAAQEGLSRIFFALPTTATANGLYARVATDFAGLFDAAASPSLVLAHGSAQRNSLFSASISTVTGASGNAGAAECAAWLASNRKASILANFGVGTIDQALLAVLRLRHQSVRLNALAGAVLIVDEVHACDTWMNTLLCTLVGAVSALGGSVVLCSATLPRKTREQLERSFGGSGYQPIDKEHAAAYPLVTLTSQAGATESASVAAHAPARELVIAHHHSEESVVGELVEAARLGQCAAWIRNTVGQAVEAYAKLSTELGPNHVTLFHSRFTAGDRRRIEESVLHRFGPRSGTSERAGHVVIATQVIEQSLDLDFDALVTDLAPIDLIIQRAGRLRRHVRSAHGTRLPAGNVDGRGVATLHVYGPEFSESPSASWYSDSLGRAKYVYPDAGQLWRTSRALSRESKLELPTQLRLLIEEVYGEVDDIPVALRLATNDVLRETQIERSLAHAQTIDVQYGYIDGRQNWENTALSVTRLGEPTIVVCLGTEVDGVLTPIESVAADAEIRVKKRWIAEAELEGGTLTIGRNEDHDSVGRRTSALMLRLEQGAGAHYQRELLDGAGSTRRFSYDHVTGLQSERLGGK